MSTLTITPTADIFDLLLGIGLIALGLSILVVVVMVEIFYFRKGGRQGDRLQGPRNRDGAAARGGLREIRGGKAAGLRHRPHKHHARGRAA